MWFKCSVKNNQIWRCYQHTRCTCCFQLGKPSFNKENLFIVTPIVGVFNCSMFCSTLLYAHSSFAIILMGKRELVALLSLSSWCLVLVVWLFLAVPWVCLSGQTQNPHNKGSNDEQRATATEPLPENRLQPQRKHNLTS